MHFGLPLKPEEVTSNSGSDKVELIGKKNKTCLYLEGGECEKFKDVPCNHQTATALQQDTNSQQKQVTRGVQDAGTLKRW